MRLFSLTYQIKHKQLLLLFDVLRIPGNVLIDFFQTFKIVIYFIFFGLQRFFSTSSVGSPYFLVGKIFMLLVVFLKPHWV